MYGFSQKNSVRIFITQQVTDIKAKNALYLDKFAKQKQKIQVADKTVDKIAFNRESYLLLKAKSKATFKISKAKDITITVSKISSALSTAVISIKYKCAEKYKYCLLFDF